MDRLLLHCKRKMGGLVSLLVRLCEKGGEKDVDIHDVDVVCCSTLQESSSGI